MKIIMTLLFVVAFTPAFAFAQNSEKGTGIQPPGEGQESLRVATWESPPFAFKNATGRWVGISIELWDAIAQELNYTYEFKEYTLDGALDALTSKKVDLGAAPFSITPDRYKTMDFSRSYMMTGFGIATTKVSDDHISTLLNRILNWDFFKTISILFGTLIFIGGLVWLFERKRNADQFARGPLDGLFSGFWWSAVTMTTVGYGDKSPITLGGRVIGLFWMFASIIIISGLTGSIAAELTFFRMTPKVSGPHDLKSAIVGTLRSSLEADYLHQEGIHPQEYKSIDEGLNALVNGSISAFVADHSILSYSAARSFPGQIEILPQPFEPNFIAFPMPLESNYVRPINMQLLKFLQTKEWDSILKKYNARQ